MRRLLNAAVIGLALVGGGAPGARAVTALGDWGNYLRYAPKVFVNNPDGKAFTLTLHLFIWPIAAWNPRHVTVRLSAPDGTAVVDGKVDMPGDTRVFQVPAGKKGVYLFEMNLPVKHPVGGPDFWVESSLDQSVVWAGPGTGHAVLDRWMILGCNVPRRWWFWVPPGTKSFTCRTQWIDRYQSQREDWGITIFSPRGQRVRTLWGDLDYDRGRPFNTDASRTMSTTVNVEPGAAGHFWCAEIRYGDSHNYSKISFTLVGVPPYVARSPEEWFDPETGASPAVPLYGDEPFMQFARPKGGDAWPWLMHFSPCPSLGDPDGAEIVGNATFALWNPENRPLKFRIGSYVPRDLGSAHLNEAGVTITGPGGNTVLDRRIPIEQLHGDNGAPEPIPLTGAGVATVRVADPGHRWFAFTYPSTPVVLIGQATGDGWSRFNLTCGTARNWYFFVPPGTRQFSVRAAAEQATDVMNLEINSPDRTLALIYDNQGEKTITVPPGLDGKIWYLRPDIGSATTMPNIPGQPTRYLHLNLSLDLKGVPGLLAPTREQWFNPASPGLQRITALQRVYKTVGGQDLLLHLFLPPTAAGAAGLRPAILFIHGGGWNSGAPDVLFAYCRYFAERGYVTASVQYRLVKEPATTMFDCFADVKSAMRWLRENATELSIDPHRVAVVGESSGGHLAACLGCLDGFDDPGDDLRVSARPDAMVIYNGVLDLTPPDGWRFLSAAMQPHAKDLSPMDHVHPGMPPALLIHGTADTVVPFAWSQRFCAEMKAAGNRAELVPMEGRNHAFALPGYGDDETVREVEQRTEVFLKSVFSTK